MSKLYKNLCAWLDVAQFWIFVRKILKLATTLHWRNSVELCHQMDFFWIKRLESSNHFWEVVSFNLYVFQFLLSVIVFYLINVTTKVFCHKWKTLTHKKRRVRKWEKIWSPFWFLRITALKGPSASLRTIQWYSFYFRFLPVPRAGRWLWGSWTVLSAWCVFLQSCDKNKKIIAMYDRWGTKVSSFSCISGHNPWCGRVQ